ncbi:non-specific lipid-transfer protein [Salmonella enterica subsp. enterica serovar Paratyphi A]
MVVSAPHAEAAVSCSTVTSSLASCITYLRSGGRTVPPGCCNGIKSLNAAAKTTPDRQAACKCIQAASSAIKGLNYGLASSLPGKCGVNLPYKISPSINCATVK